MALEGSHFFTLLHQRGSAMAEYINIKYLRVILRAQDIELQQRNGYWQDVLRATEPAATEHQRSSAAPDKNQPPLLGSARSQAVAVPSSGRGGVPTASCPSPRGIIEKMRTSCSNRTARIRELMPDRVCVIFLLGLLAVIAYSLACICMGVIYIDDCPANPEIARASIAQGAGGIIFCIIVCILDMQNLNKGEPKPIQVLNYALPFAIMFLYAPLVVSSLYVYKIVPEMSHIISGAANSTPASPDGQLVCDPGLYKFVFGMDSAFHIMLVVLLEFSIVLIIVCCRSQRGCNIFWGVLCNCFLPFIVIRAMNITHDQCVHGFRPSLSPSLGPMMGFQLQLVILFTMVGIAAFEHYYVGFGDLLLCLIMLAESVLFTVSVPDHAARSCTPLPNDTVLYLLYDFMVYLLCASVAFIRFNFLLVSLCLKMCDGKTSLQDLCFSNFDFA